MASTSTTIQALLETDFITDLVTRLISGQPLTQDQKLTLSDPGVIKTLEERLNMPITGKLKPFVYNFGLYNYTFGHTWRHNKEYLFYLAATGGHLDVVKNLATKYPDMVIKQFVSWCNEDDEIPMVARGGHVDVIEYLFFVVNDSDDINQPLLIRASVTFCYAICAKGDLDMFEEVKAFIHRTQLGHENHPNFGFQAAIFNGNLDIVRLLDDMDEAILLDLDEVDLHQMVLDGRRLNMVFAAKSGHVDVMNYILARYINITHGHQQKITLLRAALTGGNVKVINLILRYTKLKFKLEYLPSVIEGENISVLQRFELQFRDGFTSYVNKHQEELVDITDNLEVVTFLLNHGLNIKSVILSSMCRANCGILDLAVERLGKETIYKLLGDNMEPHVREYLEIIV